MEQLKLFTENNCPVCQEPYTEDLLFTSSSSSKRLKLNKDVQDVQKEKSKHVRYFLNKCGHSICWECFNKMNEIEKKKSIQQNKIICSITCPICKNK